MIGSMRFTLFLLIGLLLLFALPTFAEDAKPSDAKTEDKALYIAPAEHGWTIDAISVDADDLLTSFAAKTHLQVIVDDTVKRQITMHILDKPALDVLNVIVDAYGLSMANEDGVYMISEGLPNSPSSYLRSDIASVTTRYVSPGQALQMLPVFLQGLVKIDADRNALVLSGPEPMLEKFRQDVARFDTPPAQIMLDVNVVEFSNDDSNTFSALLGKSNGKFGLSTDSLTGQLS